MQSCATTVDDFNRLLLHFARTNVELGENWLRKWSVISGLAPKRCLFHFFLMTRMKSCH
jgi:hypothetical protein